MRMRIQPVLLVGGEGTRLAPLSTPECPKPFIPLPQGGSLLQQTVARLAHPLFAPPVLIGNARHRFAMRNQAEEAGTIARAILLEPRPCNTAMAIATATAWMQAQGEDNTVLAILPADHAIANENTWRKSVAAAATIAAKEERLVLIAMQPREASNELGYMRLEGEQVAEFREKPQDAALLLAQGWRANSGQVIARVRVLANALETHAPHLWSAACESVAEAKRLHECTLLSPEPFTAILPAAFDRAVLEKAGNVSAVACECGWRDIGTLDAFLDHACATLQEMDPPRYARTDRPWGHAETIAEGASTLAKCLTLYPGRRISLQRHAHRIEVWLVMEGEAWVELDGEHHSLTRGQSITIPQNAWHRLVNAGESKLVLMELQVGRPDEDDIERKEDDYGRV